MKMAAMSGLLALAMMGICRAQPLAVEAGNLPAGFYARAACVKPSVIGKPPASTQREDVLAYNFRIRRFNKESAAFNDCIKAYAERADHDIDRILSVVNAAAAEVQGDAPPGPLPGNMPADFYPASSCVKPNRDMLGGQPPTSDVKAMTAYNLRVAAFNDQARGFTDCLKIYQDKAKRDIEQIRAATRDVAADTSAP